MKSRTEAFPFEGRNLNYIYNASYYEGLDFTDLTCEANEQLLTQRNEAIAQWEFPEFPELNLPGTQTLELTTQYPGLLTGAGVAHGVGTDSELALGIALDHVTGVPYIPASTLKGVLRSAFRHPELIRSLMGQEVDPAALEAGIFDGTVMVDGEKQLLPPGMRDVFYDAYPVTRGKILEMDNLAPHDSDITKAPGVIKFLKVAPEVTFRFCFRLQDTHLGDQVITPEEKYTLFSQILQILGLGAKTRVGYGILKEANHG